MLACGSPEHRVKTTGFRPVVARNTESKPLDSGLRRNDECCRLGLWQTGRDVVKITGFLGGLFPTPLYHGSAELAKRPASMQAGRNDEHDEQAQSRASRVMIFLSSFLLVAGRF